MVRMAGKGREGLDKGDIQGLYLQRFLIRLRLAAREI